MIARLKPALTRRTLLAALPATLGAAIPTAFAHKTTTAPRPLTLRETYVAGIPYYEAGSVRETLRPDDALMLRREPDNPYDDLAIEVFTVAGRKLGYVPRVDNEPFARLMDAGKTVEASVTHVEPENYGHVLLKLTLRTA